MDTRPSPALDGTVLCDRYQVGDRLGRGGMADVYGGLDLRLDRPVAVKVLRPDMASQPDIRTRFEIEARAAAGLAHHNVVTVFDTGEHDGMPFIVMERLPGETLADRMAAGRVDEQWLRGVALDVLSALGAAHRAGIVHRDIKPANVLLSGDGAEAKVADFGIAKSVEGAHDLTGTNVMVGTPAYLAPERIAGEPATPQADLYALGVVLYEALAGNKPFTGDTPIAVAYAIRNTDPPALASVRPDADRQLVRTVERAMQRDPAARFDSAADMAASLTGDDTPAPTVAAARPPDATLVAAPGVLAGATGVGPDVAARARRWWPAALGIAVGLVLAVLIVSSVADIGDTPPRTNNERVATTAVPTTTVPRRSVVTTRRAPTTTEITTPATTEATTDPGVLDGLFGDDEEKPGKGNGKKDD